MDPSFRVSLAWKASSSSPDQQQGTLALTRCSIERKIQQRSHHHTTSNDSADTTTLPPVLLPPPNHRVGQKKKNDEKPIICPNLCLPPSQAYLRWVLKALCVEAALFYHARRPISPPRSLMPHHRTTTEDRTTTSEESSANLGGGSAVSTARSLRRQHQAVVESSSTPKDLREKRYSNLQLCCQSKKAARKATEAEPCLSEPTTTAAGTVVKLFDLLSDLDTLTSEQAVKAIVCQSKDRVTPEAALEYLFAHARQQLSTLGLFSSTSM